MRTKKIMLEFYNPNSNHSYKHDDNGSGLYDTIDGLKRVYSLVDKSYQERIDELAKILRQELSETKRPSETFIDNQYYLFENFVQSLYLEDKYNKLKENYKKLIQLANGLKTIMNNDYEILEEL